MQGEGIFPPSRDDLEDINAWFGASRAPLTQLQSRARESILAGARELALTIQRSLPKCADRSAALRKLREVASTSLEAIVHERGAYEARERVDALAPI